MVNSKRTIIWVFYFYAHARWANLFENG